MPSDKNEQCSLMCVCVSVARHVFMRVQEGQIPCVATNNSTVVNQAGCNPFTRATGGKRGETGMGRVRCPSFELTPGCKWMFSSPFIRSSALYVDVCLCVREGGGHLCPDTKYFRWLKVNSCIRIVCVRVCGHFHQCVCVFPSFWQQMGRHTCGNVFSGGGG